MTLRSRARRFALLLGAFLLFAAAATWSITGAEAATVARHTLPLDFEINQGQTDPQVAFLSRGSGYTFFLTSDGAVIRLTPPHSGKTIHPTGGDHASTGRVPVVTMRWLGASPAPAIEGLAPLEAKSHYLIGRDPARWKRNVAHYARVRYRGLYPGIDLIYYGGVQGETQRLEYDLIVGPGADPSAVRLAVGGIESAAVDAQGDLLLKTGAGVITQRRPVIYQEIGGVRRLVDGSYVVRSFKQGRHEVGIDVASYDRTRPLVIDPELLLSIYWGGSGDDQATGVAVNINTGDIYLAGYTTSVNDFPGYAPISLPAIPTGGSVYAFVTRLNSTGTAVAYSTFIGGSLTDTSDPVTTQALGLDVDGSGSAYIAGWTNAKDFPTCPNPNPQACPASNTSTAPTYAYQLDYGGGASDAFVAKLDKTGGTLIYSSYLGGTGPDRANGIKVNGSYAYVVGTTSSSTDFPQQTPWQNGYGGGASDAFVAKVDKKGRSLLFSTYLGGSGEDQGLGLSVGPDGAVALTGWTTSTDFPLSAQTLKVIQPQNNGGNSDAFVTKFSGDGKTLIYSTYLGGSGDDEGLAIVVDGSNRAIVTGFTNDPTNFPLPSPTYVPPNSYGGGKDAFVVRMLSTGEKLLNLTYLGGSNDDVGYGIGISPEGFIYVTGQTASGNFPTLDPLQPALNGATDAFVTRLTLTEDLDYSTFWGGAGDDAGKAIVVDVGTAHVVGMTNSSTDFPLKPNPTLPQNGYGGGASDAFLLSLQDPHATGCNMGPWRRVDRVDPGLPIVVGTAALLWGLRRLRRIRRS